MEFMDMDNSETLTEKITTGVQIQLIQAVGDSNGTKFQEAATSLENNKTLVGISLRYGAIIDAIQLIYSDGTRGELFGSPIGGEELVMVDKDDSIIVIKGKCNVIHCGQHALSNIFIGTKNGKSYGPFGGSALDVGKLFTLSVPEDKTLIGIHGTVNKNGKGGLIKSIGLIVK